MTFELLVTSTLALKPELQWLWYSDDTASFITGDEHSSYALPTSRAGIVSQLSPSPSGSRNLPIPDSLYDELAAQPWRGFRFLPRGAGDRLSGDLLRTLVFVPDYGHPVLHPASGLILALKSGSIELLKRAGDEFK